MRFTLPLGVMIGGTLLFTGCANRSGNNASPGPKKDVVAETYVHKYGVRVPKNEWSTRGKSGQVVSTLKTGVVVTKNYVDGYLDGDTTYSFPHRGSIQKVETYAEGHLTAEKENFTTGAPKKQVVYISPTSYSLTRWYEGGTPQLREIYENDRLIEGDYYNQFNQIEARVEHGEGKKIVRNEMGQLISTEKVENGMIQERTTYYPNGAPKEIIPFSNGKVAGMKKTFLPGGEPLTIEEWNDGRQEGTTVYFQDGEKVAEVPYFKGVKNGVEERYRDAQYVVEEITWQAGKKHGPSYVHIGEDTLISWYYEGKEVSKAHYDRLVKPHYR